VTVYGHAPSGSFLPTITANEKYRVSVDTSTPLQNGKICQVTENGDNISSQTPISADINVKITCSSPSFTVGGTISGLSSAEKVTLEDNRKNDQQLLSGVYEFTNFHTNDKYSISVISSPSGKTCTIADNVKQGTVAHNNVTNVDVNCETATYTLSGTVDGLDTHETIDLKESISNQTLTVTQSGTGVKPFNFTSPFQEGVLYNITLTSALTDKTCFLPSNASGKMVEDTTVKITCSTNPHLSSSVANLALSVTGHTEFGVPGAPNSGKQRTITINNSGARAASNLEVSLSGFPTGTTFDDQCKTKTLAKDETCTINITPGSTPSNDANSKPCNQGTAPQPGVITVSAQDKSTSVSVNVSILDYGCLYQGGYIFALDDTQSPNVGGKVGFEASLANSVWAADTISICGVSDGSSNDNPVPSTGCTGSSKCDANTDGVCNTNGITSLSTGTVAAGCKQSLNNYEDWYLPAICELGVHNSKDENTIHCGTIDQPSLQNCGSNLKDVSGFATKNYWSSTQFSQDTTSAWYLHVRDDPNLPFGITPYNKSMRMGAFCVRKITQPVSD
jgi:hypothetical protein